MRTDLSKAHMGPCRGEEIGAGTGDGGGVSSVSWP